MGCSANPRRHPVAAEAVGYLRHLGADDVKVIGKKSALRVAWRLEGTPMSIPLSRAGASQPQIAMALQMVRRKFREAGVEVRA